MKRILNTLFVMTQHTYLHKEGETIVVMNGDEKKLQIPAITLSGVVCFGYISVSPYLMAFLAEQGIGVSFFTETGRFLARIEGETHGNVLLRRAQYRMSDDENRSVAIARNIVLAKIANGRTVIGRGMRDHGEKIDNSRVNEVQERLGYLAEQVKKAETLDQLRGYEGDAAASYFGVFNELITSQKGDFFLNERSRRPPLDRVNAMLSFTYSLLYHDVRSAAESTGLDPSVGFLHRDRPGRFSLALDIMEEFRPFFADRLVLSLINLRQITAGDFETRTSGAVLLNEKGRKTLISAYQQRKQDVIRHPFVDEEMFIGLLFFMQPMLLARHLRGDIDGYPPYFWR